MCQFSCTVSLGFLLHFSVTLLALPSFVCWLGPLASLPGSKMPAAVLGAMLFTRGPEGECFSPLHHPTKLVNFTLIGPLRSCAPVPPDPWGWGMPCTDWLRPLFLAHSCIIPSCKEDKITLSAWGYWGHTPGAGGRVIVTQTTWLFHNGPGRGEMDNELASSNTWYR